MAVHEIIQIHIRKDDLASTRIHTASLDDTTLSDGQVLLAVDDFGFSANNITYAAFGKHMNYWGFFPVDNEFGMLPVWGFAEVILSKHPDIHAGTRVYGYLPMATHLIAQVSKVTSNGFIDGHPARDSMNAVYDHYIITDKDPAYVADRELWQMNFRPLFITSYVLGLHVAQEAQVNQVIISSASSKTALGAAHYLRHLSDRQFTLVGLTSANNVELVKSSNCYDSVICYSDIQQLVQHSAWLLDFAANGQLLTAISQHLASNLTRITLIGATDWSAQSKPSANAPNSSFFFAPTYIQQHMHTLGYDAFMRGYATAWRGFASTVEPMMQAVSVRGPEAINQLYLQTLHNQLNSATLVQANFKH